jgi:hypothetical protein
MSEQEMHYPDHFVDRLEILWGGGFLSPRWSKRGSRNRHRVRSQGQDRSGCRLRNWGR